MFDPNKLNHIFGNPAHNLGGLVNDFGSQTAALQAIHDAINLQIQRQGITGLFEEVVTVGTHQVTVRGTVINGVAQIGTAFIA